MPRDPFAQQGFQCRLEWGRRGARAAASRGDLLVVVDVLRFSTAVATAVEHGVIILPCAEEEDPAALATRMDATFAVPEHDLVSSGRSSLSPGVYEAMPRGKRVVLRSPNGGTCCRFGAEVPRLFVGALVNASAVARAVAEHLQDESIAVTVLACGERWWTPDEEGPLRMAIEDYLGAGAILAQLDFPKSPEAELCASAFLAGRDRLQDLILQCGSGRELREKGRVADVLHAARLDVYASAPVFQDGCFARSESHS